MKIKQATVYKCDHCGRNMLRKGAAEKHETYCRKNPNNMHRCFAYCKHLIKGKEGEIGETPQHTTFTCAKTGKQMWSYIAERRDLKEAFYGDNERMPLECDFFESSDIPPITVIPVNYISQ